MSQGLRWRAPIARRIAVAFLIFAAATGPSPARVPLPPHGDRSVHDLAGVLRGPTIETLERRHADLLRKTGVAIVVVTVGALEDETLADFAVRVGSEWGVGRKGEDRGIVIAVTTEEPHVFVATGYGVEGFLPDGRVGAILDHHVVGPLRARDFDRAIDGASAALAAACAGEYGVDIEGVGREARDLRSRGRIPPLLILLLFVVLLLLGLRLLFLPIPLSGRGRRRRVWYGGGFGGGFGGGLGGGGGGFGGFGGGGFGGGGAGR